MSSLDPSQRNSLIDALGEAQRIGMLGPGDLGIAVDQAVSLARLIPDTATSFVDLGSGGGLPGLAVALARPDLAGVLVDRRGKRVDLLVRLLGRLGLMGRIEAVEADVIDLPRRFPGVTWSVATSRGFGPPPYTAQHAAPLLSSGGLLLVTEPPGSTGERWETPEVRESGLSLVTVSSGIAVLVRS